MISLCTKHWQIDSINGVFFDKDGTLIDSHIFWGRIINKRADSLMNFYSINESYYDDICLNMGYSCKSKSLIEEGPIAIFPREEVINIINKFISSLNISSSTEEISELFNLVHAKFLSESSNYIKMLQGVEELLIKLKEKNIKIAIVTSDSESSTISAIKLLKIEKYFDLIISRDSSIESKESGVPSIKALEILNLKNSNVVCIGDTPIDIIMAEKSNLKAGIGVASGQISKEKLFKFTPYVISSLNEIIVK